MSFTDREPRTLQQVTELIGAIHEFLFENLVNHEVFTFGIIVSRGNRGWYITDDDDYLRVTAIYDLTISYNVADTGLPPQFQWEMRGAIDQDCQIRIPQIALTIHGSDARVSFLAGRIREFDVNDPSSLDDLYEMVK